MELPKDAKVLLAREAKNLIALRKKLRGYLYGTVTGGALQIYRVKKELEEFITREVLNTKIDTRSERKKLLDRVLNVNITIPDATEDDVVAAHLVGSSFSTAWASTQLANLDFNWDPRLRRIVATETARSFSEVTEEVAKRLTLVRRWNSIIDSRTCKFCRSLDGEETLPGKDFKDGYEPGFVHPACRCYSELVLK